MRDRLQTAALIVLCLLALSGFLWPMLIAVQHEWKQKKLQGARFDERQKLARQRAGNHAMYALLGFLALWAVVHLLGWFSWTASVLDLVLCALLLAWCVWASDCILHDGLVGWKEQKSVPNATIANLYGMWMVMMARSLCEYGVTASWLPFAFACGNWLIVGVVLLYTWRRQKREDSEAEEL